MKRDPPVYGSQILQTFLHCGDRKEFFVRVIEMSAFELRKDECTSWTEECEDRTPKHLLSDKATERAVYSVSKLESTRLQPEQMFMSLNSFAVR